MFNKNKKTENQINSWITIQSFILIGAALFALLVVNMGSTLFFGNKSNITIGYFLGLILPFCAVLGALNNYLVKATYKYFTILSDAIKNVADGNYDTTIPLEKAGPFTEVYQNFNKMSSEIRNVQILRSDFINSYAHEFKTPIVSIQGFADLLLDSEVSSEDKVVYLRIISEEANRLANLANSSILLSKLDTQSIINDKENYALDEQIRKCIIILSKDWNQKNITIDAQLDNIIYYGNEQLMQHIWLNIINNAIKFTPNDGLIKVLLFKDKDNIIIKISDSGQGMDNTIDIFDKYYQGANLDNKEGLGLGLSIVKRIIDLVDGDISVNSILNEGSTFIVKIPIN